jgi:catechol 2,3-dioxygenase-like lactoylglutathione lyase family enzyme
MLEHVSIGVKDIQKARAFYDAVLLPLGYERLANSDVASGYGGERPQFWIFQSERPVPEDPKSGLHFCFTAPSREAVTEFHAAGVEGGGQDNGKPGIRPEYATFYFAAFVIDPDGYRLEAFFHVTD